MKIDEITDWVSTSLKAENGEDYYLTITHDDWMRITNYFPYLLSEVKRLRGAIEKLKLLALRQHYYCEDCYYTCPKHPEGCCNDALDKDKCDCGADEHNQKVEELYKALEGQQ